MKRFLRVFKNTTVRIFSFLLFILFIASIFIFKDFYKSQWHKTLSFYYVYLGDNYYKKHKPQKAIESYIKALELYPRHYRAQYNLGNLYVVYEDYYSALDSYSKALQVKPDFTVARINYAIVLSEATFNYDKAIEEYDLAAQNIPKWMYIPFIVNKKHSYKHNKAVAFYNQGLAWRGKSLLYGEDRFKARRFLENAVSSYEKALKTMKTFDVYYNLAIVHHLLRNPEYAGYYYCKAIEKEPMRYEGHYNFAILLRSLKKYSDSMEEFKKAGLILDGKGDSNKTMYVYDILNEVNQKYSVSDEYIQLKAQLEEDKKQGIESIKEEATFVQGKTLVLDESGSAMIKNFRQCASKKYFEDGIKN